MEVATSITQCDVDQRKIKSFEIDQVKLGFDSGQAVKSRDASPALLQDFLDEFCDEHLIFHNQHVLRFIDPDELTPILGGTNFDCAI